MILTRMSHQPPAAGAGTRAMNGRTPSSPFDMRHHIVIPAKFDMTCGPGIEGSAQ